MAPLSSTPTSSPPPASSTVDPFPPVSPISTASSPPSSPRTATDLSQPGSPKRMDDGGLEEREIDWSKDYSLGFGMEFDTETAAYDFYNDHGRVMGFSIRKSYFTRSKKDDQDAAMAKAISIVMPDVTHGLCTFHLQQNALKHLGHLYKEDSDFGKDFSACIFEYIEEEELIQGWDALVKKYDLNENMWIKKTWGLREKWAHAYLKLSFTAGMRSTQLSESLNAKVKKYVKFDHDIVQFFTHFDRLVMEKREEESDSIYHSREKLQRQKLKKSPILIQVAKLYTPPIFDLFHDQDVPIPYIPEMINCGSNSQSAPSSSEMKLVNYGLNGSFFGIMDDFILGMQASSNPKPLNLCSSSVNCFSSQNFTNLLLIVSKKFISIGDAGRDESVTVLGYKSGEMRDVGGNRSTVMLVVVRKWLLATREAIDGGNRSTVMPVVVRKWLLATGEAID
ncbi:hypothetical protein RHMOL_Rhmol13G0033200 [Rhododendron molle]|uniref:Uncharacterized protein n=1 Tax=Rhododendron molle TaxID=49168 RepID=A0ACC0L3U7_RHOML|nr:hypothetical protein RHMOL_Rhmol13G0033200 [Rhododendron molle]